MTEDLTSWHHTPFGRRMMTPNAPYFVIVNPPKRADRDAAARLALAQLAGL